MTIDTSAAVTGAIGLLSLAFTLTKKRLHKLIFLVIGLIGIIAAFWLAARADKNSDHSSLSNAENQVKNSQSINVGPGSAVANGASSTAVSISGTGNTVYNNPIAPVPDDPTVFVPGTSIKVNQIKTDFALGYIVIRKGDGRWTYEPDIRDQITLKNDFSKIQIDPDFPSGVVRWSIPDFGWVGTSFSFLDDYVAITASLTPGIMIRVRDIIEIRGGKSMPSIWVGTLSEDQAHPVFLLGLRYDPPKYPWTLQLMDSNFVNKPQ